MWRLESPELRRLESPHFSTLLHAVFSHIYFVMHDDEISTSASYQALLLVSYSQHCKPDDGLRVGRNMLFH